MKGKFVLFLSLGLLIWGAGIKDTARRMGYFYRSGNMIALEKEKEHLNLILKDRARTQTRWPSEFMLTTAVERRDLKTLYYLNSIDKDNYKIPMAIGHLLMLKGHIFKGISFLTRAAYSYIFSPEGFYFSVYFFSKLIPLSFLIILFFLSLSLIFKYSPLLHHDLKETWKGRVPAIVLYIALLLLPAVLFPGWGYLVFFIPAIFTLYAEENYSSFLLVVLLLVTLLASLLPSTGKPRFSDTYRMMSRLYFYDEDAKTLKEGEKVLSNKWDDDLAYYLGYSYQRLGELSRAVGLYEKILKHNPMHVKAMVALAKIRFMSQEYPICLDLLRRAYARSNNIIPLYDLAYTYETLGNINETAKYSSRGLKEFGNRWERLRNQNSGFKDLGWNSREVFWKAFGREVGDTGLPPEILAAYYPFMKPAILSPFLVGFLLFLFGLYLLKKIPGNIGSARYCKGCGKPICERCSEYYYKGYCEDCMNMIQLTRGDMSSSMSMGIIRQRRKYELFTDGIPSFLGYFIPGTELFASGKFVGWGFSFLFVFFAMAGILSLYLSLPFYPHLFLGAFLFYLISQIYIELKAWR